MGRRRPGIEETWEGEDLRRRRFESYNQLFRRTVVTDSAARRVEYIVTTQ